jgi:hypothetical protein
VFKKASNFGALQIFGLEMLNLNHKTISKLSEYSERGGINQTTEENGKSLAKKRF